MCPINTFTTLTPIQSNDLSAASTPMKCQFGPHYHFYYYLLSDLLHFTGGQPKDQGAPYARAPFKASTQYIAWTATCDDNGLVGSPDPSLPYCRDGKPKLALQELQRSSQIRPTFTIQERRHRHARSITLIHNRVDNYPLTEWLRFRGVSTDPVSKRARMPKPPSV